MVRVNIDDFFIIKTKLLIVYKSHGILFDLRAKTAFLTVFKIANVKIILININFNITVTTMSFQSQLKKYFSLSIETLLLVGPIFMFLIFLSFYKSLSIDPFFSISIPFIIGNNIIIIHLALFVLPYIMHRLLRDKQKGSFSINLWHISLSIFLLFALLFTYQINSPLYQNNSFNTVGMPAKKLGLEATIFTYIVLAMQLILQLAFVLHSLLLLFPSKEKSEMASYS